MAKQEKITTTFTLPSSKESEMMVLGCMLTSINSLNIGSDSLHTQDFYYGEHKLVFDALKTAYQNDKPADIHIIAEELKRQKKLKEAGGIAYLTTLAQYAGTSAYIEEYITIVKNKALLRKMIHVAQKIEKEAIEEKQEVLSLLDEAQQQFFAVSQDANSTVGIQLKDILSGLHSESSLPYLKELQEKQEDFHTNGADNERTSGIPTLYTDLDGMIDGLNPANLVIVAGRPSMGKTAFCVNIAENVCFKAKKSVAVFSLEMTAEELMHRMICSQAEVESEKIKSGSLDGIEYQRIVAAVNEMQKHTFIIDDQPGLKISDLRARARRLKEVYNIELLIIDYLQLLSGARSNYSPENRQNEISEISRMLKNLARELAIPIICPSQLSRRVEERTGHRPMLSDLRESGCLTGDTLIYNVETKQHISIEELAKRETQTPIKVLSIGANDQAGEYTLVKAFYSGEKETFELKLASGKSIEASANHPFYTKDGWTRLDQLQVNMQLAIPNSLDKDTSISWDKIISITSTGVKPVYDATVEESHNFVANGIFVHNSIEQDADIVMFLFRPEYYNAQHKPGMAEVIIAKNRHGKIGTVNLTFRKSLAQFQNYTPVEQDATPDNDAAFAAFSTDRN